MALFSTGVAPASIFRTLVTASAKRMRLVCQCAIRGYKGRPVPQGGGLRRRADGGEHIRKRQAVLARKRDAEALASDRHRIMRLLALAAALVMIPFALRHLIHEHHALGASMLCALAVLGIDAASIRLGRRRPRPRPLGLLVIPVIVGIAIALPTQGVGVVLWMFPAALLFYFAMPRFAANVYNTLLLVSISALAWHYAGWESAARIISALMLTIILVNVALNIIDGLQNRLIEQTIIDPLTGAFNRRHMLHCLQRAIERSRRNGVPAALLLIDIDHFKRINDELGHAAGDSVLTMLVETISRRIRRYDLLFRIGGEEFLLLLPDTFEVDAATLAEDLRKAVMDADLLQSWRMTVSIGISEWHPDESQDAWLKHADEALYMAKRNGRNRIMQRAELPVA